MTLAFGWDAAFCPDPPPAEINGERMSYAGFYLGGSSAYHVWNAGERQLLARSGLRAMPIWVPTPGSDNPRQVAIAAAAALDGLRFKPFNRPWFRPLMWDLETGIEPDPGWVSVAAATLHARGYDSILYGSPAASHIFAEPLGPGWSAYLVAFYDGIPQLYPHPHVIGKQYAANVNVPGGQVDLNVVDASLLAHLGTLSG
jgi:hypothetical protein